MSTNYQNLSNEETREQFITEHKQGIGIKKLCRKYGIGSATAYRWLDDGTPRPVNGFATITPRQIYQMRAETEGLRKMVQIYEDCNMSDMLSLKDKCALVDKWSGKYSIHVLCKTLKLRRSTYYHHLRSPEKTLLEKQDEELRPLIKSIFEESHERFGAHKIKVVLAQRGVVVCEKRIAKLMKQMNLVCKQCRLRIWSSANRQYKYYPDRLKKKFTQTAPNQVWVSDVTYVRVKDVFYYVCAILDLFSRRIVGWKISGQNSSDMLLEAFESAFKQRGKPNALMLHSDQGANYTSYMFRSFLRELNVTQSFSHPGTPHDNAVNESFFACMKREELSHKFYNSVEELTKDVGEYAAFYNGMRPHERLGDKTPMQIEAEYWQQQENKKRELNTDTIDNVSSRHCPVSE